MTRLAAPPRQQTAAAPDRAPARFADRLRGFARRYGWRAYALPILAVITVVALIPIGGGGGSDQAARPAGSAMTGSSAPPTASTDGQVKVDTTGGNAVGAVEDSAQLPPGDPYTEQGDGTYTVVPGVGSVAGSGPLRRYSVEYENGIAGIDMTAVTATIEATLSDPRSWTGDGQFSLQRVDSGAIDFRITITSSLTVRTLCGYEQQIETSCYDPASDRVVLNDSRWVRGAVAYANDLDTYRHYMINHETGHALGFEHVFACLPGGKAPIMMQQTITVQAENGQMCQPNPWPHPAG